MGKQNLNWKKLVAIAGLALFLMVSVSRADDIESRIRALENTLKAQQETIEKQQKIIEQLKEEIAGLKTRQEAVVPTEPSGQKSPYSGGLFGGSALLNPNLSLILNTFGYTSNIRESELGSRGIPGFTAEGIEYHKGMNLEAAELYLFAPVDPFFNLYATIPATEDGATVEEAYLVTTSLPAGLQVKVGKFRSGFGRLNAQHSHVWNFVDAPLAYRAFTGEEGIDEKGIQITYLPNLPFYMQVGVEAFQGENEVLFGKDASSGLHAFSAFAKASFDVGDNGTILLGPSVIAGRTKTGSIAENTEFTGDSTLCDFEFTYKWKPSRWRSFTLQSEYLWRHQNGILADLSTPGANQLERTQDGLYVQGIYQMGRWAFGTRYDILNLFKKEYILDGVQQDFGDKPWRLSGQIEFNPSEFSRIRLQYNWDKSGPDNRTNNEWLLQFTMGIGAHAAHTF